MPRTTRSPASAAFDDPPVTTVRERPSPNHDARPAGQVVDMLILHYTGMPTAEAALDRLCDPAARVSAHYAVDEDGTVTRLVAEERRAWHAGVASWRGDAAINARSIGIELVNPGHAFGYRAFPAPQLEALVALARGLVERHPIPARHVLGHSDVAPARKEDPGELFPWKALAARGIGLWPPHEPVKGEMGMVLSEGSGGPAVHALQQALARFGYGVPVHGAFDRTTAQVVTAFQRHFRQSRVDGVADPETAQMAFAVAALAD